MGSFGYYVRGMMNKKWDKRFLDLAEHVSTWSKDPSTQVGAVIANDKRIVSVGYNGFPKQLEDKEEWLNDREIKYRHIIHGEVNALLNSKTDTEGCTLYTWPLSPCVDCMKLMIQAGIARMVYPTISDELKARWGESLEHAYNMAFEAGVELVEL
tara:strand:- start:710 stop:1174 length:465 start_codon:yes stop_codon:yes gene_type:complete